MHVSRNVTHPILLKSKPCSQIEQQLYTSYWRQKLEDRSILPFLMPVKHTPPPASCPFPNTRDNYIAVIIRLSFLKTSIFFCLISLLLSLFSGPFISNFRLLLYAEAQLREGNEVQYSPFKIIRFPFRTQREVEFCQKTKESLHGVCMFCPFFNRIAVWVYV